MSPHRTPRSACIPSVLQPSRALPYSSPANLHSAANKNKALTETSHPENTPSNHATDAENKASLHMGAKDGELHPHLEVGVQQLLRCTKLRRIAQRQSDLSVARDAPQGH